MSIQTFSLFVPACFAINMAFGPNNMLAFERRASGRAHVGACVVRTARRVRRHDRDCRLGTGRVAARVRDAFHGDQARGRGLPRVDRHQAHPLGTANHHGRGGRGRCRTRAAYEAGVSRRRRQSQSDSRLHRFLPQFVDRSAYATSFAILGAIFLLFELVAIVIYAALGARLGSLSRGARGFRWFNRVSGALMIGFGVMLALVRRPAA